MGTLYVKQVFQDAHFPAGGLVFLQVRVGTQRVASITAVEMAQTTCAGEHVVAGFQANDFLVPAPRPCFGVYTSPALARSLWIVHLVATQQTFMSALC